MQKENQNLWIVSNSSSKFGPFQLKIENLKIIKARLSGWQLESFEESYTYKIENGISLFKKNLKNE